ncbi:recombinase family protein [Mycolicibacterium sp. XJ2]
MKAKKQVRAAIYTRISLDKSGERLGVQRQLDDCEALADRLGWTVADHFDDNDLSAYSGKTRPGFEALLDSMKREEVDALICWHPDRLYRSLKDLVRLLDVASGVEIRTVNGGDLDLSTATGKMLATILGSVAFNESEHKAERQRRAARQKAEQGLPQWKRAFGYLGDTYKPDPKTAPLVAQGYASILAGASLGEICREWNDAGALTIHGKRWTQPQMSNFLRKPRNAGLRAHNGEIVGKGIWPALVDESIWRATQTVLDAPGRAPGRKTVRRHLLTGVLLCGRDECGGYLSGMHTIDKRITYSCKSCRGVSIRAEHVEPLISGIVSERLARPDAVDLLKTELHDEAEAEALRVERMALLSRLDEIADERADGLLTGQQAQRATARIGKKLDAIERRQQDAERLRVFDGLPLGKPEVAEKVRHLSPDRLRAVMDVLAEFVVKPVGKGHRANGERFDPERVQVDWK